MKSLVPFFVSLLLSINTFAQGTWTSKATVPGGYRQYAMSFAIGNKGYIFMGDGLTLHNDVWEYDPSTNTWTQKANFPGPARAQAVTFTIGNKGYMCTGINVSTSTVYKDLWEYDPATDTWTQKANLPGSSRCASVGFSIGNKGYIGTGNVNPGVLNDFWEYDPATNNWTQKANFPGSARWGATGFSVNGKGYIGVGVKIPAPPVQSDFYEYNPATNTWKAIANFPGTSSTGYELTGFSICSNGYIATGWTAIQPFSNQCWEYNPTSNAWAQMASVPLARIRDVSFVINNKAYLGSGENGTALGTEFYEFTVCSLPPVAYFKSSDSVFCKTNCINFTDSTINSPDTWNWQFPGGTPSSSTSQNPSNICFNTAGTYTVSLIASNSSGSDTITHKVIVNPCSVPPVPLMSTITPSFCVGTCLTMKDSSLNNPSTWSWQFPGGTPATSTAKNPGSVCYTTAGTYTITLVASNNAGSDSTKKTITVNPSPNVVGSGNANICMGTLATLSVSGATSYTWSPATGLAATNVSTNTANPATSQTYTVTGTTNGCSDTAIIKVNVRNNPVVNVSGNKNTCPGASTVLTANGAFNYSWTPTTALSSNNAASTTAKPLTTTTYTITGSDTLGCKDTATITIKVTQVQFLTSGGDTSIIDGASVQLSSSGGTNYTWTPSSSLSCDTCATPIAKPTNTTLYIVQSTNANGCVDADSILVYVENVCDDLFLPTAFSPNEDLVNDTLYLRGSCILFMKLRIFDRWGQMVFETVDPKLGWDGKLNGSLVNSGVYFYDFAVTTKKNETITKKGNITVVR